MVSEVVNRGRERGDNTCKRLCEEGDMGCFVIGDFFEVVVECLVEAGLDEVFHCEVLEAFTIKLVLYSLLV